MKVCNEYFSRKSLYYVLLCNDIRVRFWKKSQNPKSICKFERLFLSHSKKQTCLSIELDFFQLNVE